MIWCSGWKLASAVSNEGGLGLLGSGSMYPDILRDHIRKCKAATDKPFGVNVPLLYPDIDKHMDIILEEGVDIVFTSAGNPALWTPMLKEKGIAVVHVIANSKFAGKAVASGVDAVVAEGFEAGGHNGKEETTTLCLIPEIKQIVDVPVIAAGGISTGRSMLSMMALGADGVQIGSRFAATVESSAHENFKNAIVKAKGGDTKLMMKKLVPVRLLKNKFYDIVEEAENRGASREELQEILGRARAKRGMFEGNLDEGELEIGQISGSINDIIPAGQVMRDIIAEYNAALAELSGQKL